MCHSLLESDFNKLRLDMIEVSRERFVYIILFILPVQMTFCKLFYFVCMCEIAVSSTLM